MTDLTDADVQAKAMLGSAEPSYRWVRVKVGEETIADSSSPILLLQYGPDVLPTYFFTRDEVRMDQLVPSADRDGKRFWTIELNGRRIPDAAWTYIAPPEHLSALKDRLTFSWEKLEWYEEDERVFVHARDPHKRVDVLASSRHVQVLFAGQIVADTHRPYLLFETDLPTRYYIPETDVRMEYLHETSHTSQCPYKGEARYWTVQVGDQTLKNGVWSYPDPVPENPKIKGLLCFYNEKTDIYVDSELMPRPVTPWS
jgi:uncharacterized protein (DUF427 family)